MNKIERRSTIEKVPECLSEAQRLENLYVANQSSVGNNITVPVESGNNDNFANNQKTTNIVKHSSKSTFYNPLFKYDQHSSHFHVPKSSAILALKDNFVPSKFPAKNIQTTTSLYL